AGLGSLEPSDREPQVTYRGMPLYRYSGDEKAGDVKGQGVGGVWHAIAPSGALITKSVKTATGSGSSSSSGGSTSGGSTSGGSTSGGSTGGGTTGGGSSGSGSTGGTN